MKLLTAFSIAVLSLSFGANAFAQSRYAGTTRAEVRAQLVQAEASGYLPTPKGDYPPTASAIARNREIYAIQHGTDDVRFAQVKGSPASHPDSASN
ncbi:DUF4148 domain-containing protein (plasmid) [Paraburkholderia sp. D15]|uniref:DUF4148 domain-containing protein n=1 Tax=Paraburkholderia sp. D15 TaxID=2880218 RepID=UPI00247836F8|nr:DUF4148 domain-containing protein [Paraburkholderia sp. D15]WGS54904.1 DUF4148 domain-containing protein [Paraburkholderia sp. D15]